MNKVAFCKENVKTLEEQIGKYLNVSLAQDKDKLGYETTYVLFLAAKEYFIMGTVSEIFKDAHNFTKNDQNLLQDILNDYLALYTNQNLVEMFVNRVRMMKYLFEQGEEINRPQINQLVKILERVESRSTFNVLPLNLYKQFRFKLGLGVMSKGIDKNYNDGLKLESQASILDLDRVRDSLQRIRTR